METVVSKAALGNACQVRRLDWTTEGARIPESGVVDQDEQYVGSAGGWYRVTDQVPIWLRSIQRLSNRARENWAADRQMSSVDIAHGYSPLSRGNRLEVAAITSKSGSGHTSATALRRGMIAGPSIGALSTHRGRRATSGNPLSHMCSQHARTRWPSQSIQESSERPEKLLMFAGLLAELSVMGAESLTSALRRLRILFPFDLLG